MAGAARSRAGDRRIILLVRYSRGYARVTAVGQAAVVEQCFGALRLEQRVEKKNSLSLSLQKISWVRL